MRVGGWVPPCPLPTHTSTRTHVHTLTNARATTHAHTKHATPNHPILACLFERRLSVCIQDWKQKLVEGGFQVGVQPGRPGMADRTCALLRSQPSSALRPDGAQGIKHNALGCSSKSPCPPAPYLAAMVRVLRLDAPACARHSRGGGPTEWITRHRAVAAIPPPHTHAMCYVDARAVPTCHHVGRRGLGPVPRTSPRIPAAPPAAPSWPPDLPPLELLLRSLCLRTRWSCCWTRSARSRSRGPAAPRGTTSSWQT